MLTLYQIKRMVSVENYNYTCALNFNESIVMNLTVKAVKSFLILSDISYKKSKNEPSMVETIITNNKNGNIVDNSHKNYKDEFKVQNVTPSSTCKSQGNVFIPFKGQIKKIPQEAEQINLINSGNSARFFSNNNHNFKNVKIIKETNDRKQNLIMNENGMSFQEINENQIEQRMKDEEENDKKGGRALRIDKK